MGKMIADGRAEDQYIVKVDDDKFSNERSKQLIYNTHESTWRIRQPERHHKPFK